MTAAELARLAVLIRQEKEAVLAQWRAQVRQLPSAAHLSVPALNDHIPALLDELADAFATRSEETIVEAMKDGSPPTHGAQRFMDGFDIVEVVAEYNILRGCVHDLAMAHELNLVGNAFHILNRVFDGAIAYAVDSYATQRALEVQHRREEYLAFVAHDLRTPLTALSITTSMLAEDADAGELGDKAPLLRIIQRNIAQLQVLVNKVLEENDNLRTEVGVKIERRTFDLWPMVEGLIHDLRPIGGSGSTVLINEVSQDLTVFADADLLRRIFQNLIGNAITYTPRGEVRIGASANDASAVTEFWVSDTGTGIPADLLANVFAKGETDGTRTDSLGLGLAIVKSFVEAHGGEVHAESTADRGCTIRFTLPFAARS